MLTFNLQSVRTITIIGMSNIYKPKKIFNVTKHPMPDDTEPSSVRAALKNVYWRKAMSDEFNALVKHGTWYTELLNDLSAYRNYTH